MAKKIKDTDYLFLSARLRAMEQKLLTGARMERMIDAPTAADAARVLGEIGYGDFSPTSDQELSRALAAEREKVFQELYQFVPDRSVVDVFKVKYDYHNVKAVLKSLAVGADTGRLLVDAGRVPAEKLAKALEEGDYTALPEKMQAPCREAHEVLSATGDPQQSDFILDAAYYQEMLQAAQATGSDLLRRYVQATIDAANLRSAVRTLRMHKGGDFLRQVLFAGGTVPMDRVMSAALGGSLEDAFRSGGLRTAAELGVAAIRGGSLTAFEKACDDAVTVCAAQAKAVPFGVEVVIGYLVAKEIEFTAVRVIMAGKMAGISGGTIRERLRESHV